MAARYRGLAGTLFSDWKADMNIHKIVFGNVKGVEPEWLDGQEIEQAFRWCFKGGGGGGTSTTTSEPWAEQKPFLEFGFEQARKQFDKAKPQYFPGSTVTPLNAYQTQAWDMGGGTGTGGKPVIAGRPGAGPGHTQGGLSQS